MDAEKQIQELSERLSYMRDVFGDRENSNIGLLGAKLQDFLDKDPGLSPRDRARDLNQLVELFSFLEKKLEMELTPMDKVRIVRHPQRICLLDILENVYDNYTEIAGQNEFSIDPAIVIARATLARRVGKKVINQSVMVIGQEKGHGQEFRNGGSVKPWGNAKALHYMKIAETENIPVHTYVFTPGSYPIEDYPGAAQQIARNLYEMAGLKVPVVAVFSEGGSGGAEAIGLADKRLMMSHGYYSVISPEGAAAIEGRLKSIGGRAGAELIEKCARQLKITAKDNLEAGYIDKIIQEPPLGARPHHFEFFKSLRQEVIAATNEVVADVRGLNFLRAMAIKRRMSRDDVDVEAIFMRWSLNNTARDRLIDRRHDKFRRMCKKSFKDTRSTFIRTLGNFRELMRAAKSSVQHDIVGLGKRKLKSAREEVEAEIHVLKNRLVRDMHKLKVHFGMKENGTHIDARAKEQLTELSNPEEGVRFSQDQWQWISPQSNEDQAVTCPNAESDGCMDLWGPDLYGEFAGVCSNCGHHFKMEYSWYLHNVFDFEHAFEFNREIESKNPLGYEGFDIKLDQAKKKTGNKSACITFETKIKGIKSVVAVLTAPFRGGSVGAAEGEKFIRAAERAGKQKYPFVAYVHGTAGIRIQEGTHGVIQMPRCTMAVRKYIENGGLYVVIHDTNSYAGPVASFLGCAPYQLAIRSSNIGFAGPGVIRETTGLDIPKSYHNCYQALSRGHIQGIWDRREMKNNLHHVLMTVGGRNLYYR